MRNAISFLCVAAIAMLLASTVEAQVYQPIGKAELTQPISDMDASRGIVTKCQYSSNACRTCDKCRAGRYDACERARDRACEPACDRACDRASNQACEPACGRACDRACDRACEPACGRTCDRACGQACEPACGRTCDQACGQACEPACGRTCDRACDSACDAACDSACDAAACGDQAGCCDDVGCCDSCGASGCLGCCDWRESATTPGLYAGFEVVFMKPYFRHRFLDFDLPEPLNLARNARCGFDFESTPRIWAGLTTECGLGFRTRWWQFDHASTATWADDLGFPVGDTFLIDADASVTRELEMNVFDFEVTQDLNWCKTAIKLGAGARYTRFQQKWMIAAGLRAARTDFDPIIRAEASALVAHELEGAGPTVSLDLRRRIGCSCLYLVGGLRESVLFVNSSRDLAAGFESNYPTLEGGDIGVAWEGCESVLAVTEINVGLEFQRCMGCATLVGRVGYEGQIWHDGDRLGLMTGDLGMHGISVGGGIIL